MDLSLNASYVTLLLQRLGRRKDTSLRESALDEMNMAKARLEQGRFLPWFLGKSISVTFPAGVRSYVLPADFLSEEEDFQFRLEGPTDSFYTIKKGIQDVLQEQFKEREGIPKYYSILGNELQLWPLPDIQYTSAFYYKARQASFTDAATTVTNPWLLNAADWLLMEAGVRLAGFHLQNPNLAKLCAAAAAEAKDNLLVIHEAREHVNVNYTDDAEYI